MRLIEMVAFSRGPWPSSVYILMVMMVLIDRAGEELSNGGQFIKIDDLDLGYGILAVKPDWAELGAI